MIIEEENTMFGRCKDIIEYIKTEGDGSEDENMFELLNKLNAYDLDDFLELKLNLMQEVDIYKLEV